MPKSISHVSAAPDIPGHRLLRQIGAGASGEVWICRNEVDRRMLALKIVCFSGPSRREWFEKELKALRAFAGLGERSDCLIDIRHVAMSEGDGFLYYTMPLADGAGGVSPESAKYLPLSLGSRLRRDKMLGLRESAEIAARVLTALKMLHAHKLLHRDIKPDNILFRNGKAVLADIGLVTKDVTLVSGAGTPKYMEPGVKQSALTDLFAVGKVLYEMISGKDAAADFPDCGSRKDRKDIKLYPALNNICLRACGDRETRYTKAGEMLRDLEAVLSGKNVEANGIGERCLPPTNKLLEGSDPKWTQLLGPEQYAWGKCRGHLFKMTCPFNFIEGATNLNTKDMAKVRVAVFLPKAFRPDTPMVYVIADTWADFRNNEDLLPAVLECGYGMVTLDTPLTGICKIGEDADEGEDGANDAGYCDAVVKLISCCGASNINERLVLGTMRFTARNLWFASRFLGQRFGIRPRVSAVVGTGFGVHAAGYAFNESGFGDALLGISGIPESDDYTVFRMLSLKMKILKTAMPWACPPADRVAAKKMNPATYACRVLPPRTVHLLFGDEDKCFVPVEVYESLDRYTALKGRDSETFLFREDNRKGWSEALVRILRRGKGIAWYDGDDDYSDWRGDLLLQFIKTRLQLLKKHR